MYIFQQGTAGAVCTSAQFLKFEDVTMDSESPTILFQQHITAGYFVGKLHSSANSRRTGNAVDGSRERISESWSQK